MQRNGVRCLSVPTCAPVPSAVQHLYDEPPIPLLDSGPVFRVPHTKVCVLNLGIPFKCFVLTFLSAAYAFPTLLKGDWPCRA